MNTLPNAVITNFSLQANVYRNMMREQVDNLFLQRDKYLTLVANELQRRDKADKARIHNWNNLAEQYDTKARELWHNIVEHAEDIFYQTKKKEYYKESKELV